MDQLSPDETGRYAEVVEAGGDMTRAHVVVTREMASGRVTHSGPYPDAVSAARAVETERADLGRDAGGFFFSVAVLYPPAQ